MSKGTYSYSNRHRMHENLVPKLGTKKGTKMEAEIEKMFEDAKPLTEADLKAFGEKNREIMDSPSFKAGVLEDEVTNLKGIIKELKRTLSKCMYALQENEELKRELEACRESYQVLADDYQRLRGLMKRDKEILDYILSDDTNAEVYIQGMLCLALSRDEMEKVMREDPHHPAY